jgi:hypothetical protein
LRLAQLRLWDRPPISESRVAAWIHVGLASVLHRRDDLEGCRARLELATRAAARAGAAAEDASLPFVAFRKYAGLAYCSWQLGDVEAGVRWARQAAEQAGDGGFVRFRIMALNLLTRMLPADEAAAVNARAERLSRQLEDEELRRRVTRFGVVES